MNARKTYYFSSSSNSWIPELTISPRVGSNAQRHQPSEATYQRFVALANSGDYTVEIQPFDCGVAWELRRKAAKPAPDAQDFYNEDDYNYALEDYKFRRQQTEWGKDTEEEAEARTDYAQ